MQAKMWRKGNPLALLVGMQIGAATVESSMKIPQKIKNGTAQWPSNSTSGNISEETQNTNLKRYMHPCVHCGIIFNSQDAEVSHVPISRWVDEITVVRICNGILLLSYKKEWNLTICDSMVGPKGCFLLSEISQREEDKYCMISLICGI